MHASSASSSASGARALACSCARRASLAALASLPGVGSWRVDYCQFGAPWRKRTKFLTNIPEVKEELGVTCDGRHQYQQLISGRARAAEEYPEELCRAIIRGLINQMKMDGRIFAFKRCL